MRYRPLLSSGLLLLLGTLAGAHASPPALDDLKKKAAVLRPSPEESRWRRIPWVTDLAEGQRVAREERRASVTAQGLVVHDLKQGSLRSLLLVFAGTYRHHGDGPEPIGAVVEWVARAETAPPPKS